MNAQGDIRRETSTIVVGATCGTVCEAPQAPEEFQNVLRLKGSSSSSELSCSSSSPWLITSTMSQPKSFRSFVCALIELSFVDS